MNIRYILNTYCKPIMKWYYKNKYREDIYKMLCIIKDGEQVKMTDLIYKYHYQTGFSIEKSTKVFGICHYLGFIGNK